jgi:hypothetical protein
VHLQKLRSRAAKELRSAREMRYNRCDII